MISDFLCPPSRPSLTFSTVGKNFSRWHIEIFVLIFSRKQDLTFHANCLHFSQKTGFDSSCKLETVCIKSLILFFGKHKKNTINWSSAVFAHRVKLSFTKLCLYNIDPLKPHFYIVKLGFKRCTIYFFLFLLQNIDCGYSLEPPRRGGSNMLSQSMFWPEIIIKKYQFCIWKLSVFGGEIFYIFE